jgi:hypothetical protein
MVQQVIQPPKARFTVLLERILSLPEADNAGRVPAAAQGTASSSLKDYIVGEKATVGEAFSPEGLPRNS